VRPSSFAFLFIAVLGLAVAGIFGLSAASTLGPASASVVAGFSAKLASQRELVARLGLTDLALMTEARYTRHPSQADLHSAFQDHPAAFDHFPGGAVLPPPAHLTRKHEPLAGTTTSPD
jgi:hypothetical protein